jgi:hypothetical protein
MDDGGGSFYFYQVNHRRLRKMSISALRESLVIAEYDMYITFLWIRKPYLETFTKPSKDRHLTNTSTTI